MAQPFPFPLVALIDNRRVMLADFGVKEHAGAYVELFEHVHDAKNTDARAVIAQRVTRHVRRVIFFFSSRRRHTRCLSDWSSDVCSSDLCSSTSSTTSSPARASTGSTRTRPATTPRWPPRPVP